MRRLTNDSIICFEKRKRYPFNTKNPLGFIVAIVIEYVFVVNLMIIPKCFYTTGITALPMLFSLASDIKSDLNAIQQSLSYKRKRSKMGKPLSQFIQFYSDARQLSNLIRN